MTWTVKSPIGPTTYAEKRGQDITLSVPDAIIAVTAIVHNLALVTLNQAHFEAIAGLSLYPLAEEG